MQEVTTKTTADGWVVVSIDGKEQRQKVCGGPIVGGEGIQMFAEEPDHVKPDNPDNCPVMEVNTMIIFQIDCFVNNSEDVTFMIDCLSSKQLLIEQENAKKAEEARECEEDEKLYQERIAAVKTVGAVGVAAGSAVVGATVAVGTEVLQDAKIVAAVASNGVAITDEVIRRAVGELVHAAKNIGDIASDLVIQKLGPDDLLGMYGAFETFLSVLMAYVVEGLPLAKIPPVEEFAKSLLVTYRTPSRAVHVLVAGAEDSSLKIVADG
jgi:hypothetical protein